MGEEPSIRALDEATIQRIAAGEVVERPASVVKELVENSLDADAERVSVSVESGGIDGIHVRDDGAGMTPAEIEVAVEEHTTSKISDIDDLESGVTTLGFRGEALSTIGAVSRMTVRSRPRDADTDGAELTVEGGSVGDVAPAGCPPGTVVEVEDLFFNTPARKKFLKTRATEFDHVNTVVTQYALANPDVAVSLEHNGREVFSTDGRGSLESTILSVYGREVAESIVTVSADGDATDDGDTAIEAISGVVSHPETTRASRDYLSTFVNGRYVTSATLREAVLDAYGKQLAPDRYPFAVLFLEVPTDSVDVNVHPRKMEVRFDDESAVQRAVEGVVESALLESGLVRSSAPRGRSAPAETRVAPEASGGNDGVDDGDRTEREGVDASVTDAMDATDSASATDAASRASADTATAPTDFDVVESPSGGSDRRHDLTGDTTDEPTGRPPGQEASAPTSSSRTRPSTTPSEPRQSSPETPTESSPSSTGWAADGVEGQSPISPPSTQQTLAGDDARADESFERLPPMRVLGQLQETYIVAETADGLVLVDQHAADERVNYERLRGEVEGDTPTQALAEPVRLELTAREAALFDEYADALAQVGFHAGVTDARTVEVRTVPAVFDSALDPALLRDALTAFVREEREGGRETVDAVADALLSDLACYPSITGNTSLTEGSVVDLLRALDDCENPYACPHGRPVVIEFDGEEIRERFERDYPGHAGRRRE
ncbi:MAG: DNA mismatch repair endonuclease MutL [Halobacteriota archaeon]